MYIKDRTFVVSGGASGLGRATVSDLHALGAYVAILDMNKDNGEALIKELGGRDRAQFFEVDVSDTESIERCVEGVIGWTKDTKKALGGVVAAAGVGNPGKTIDRDGEPLNLEGFDFVININLRGTVDLVRQFMPAITKNEPIEDGERGQPGQVAYSASKGAIASLTLPMARDLAQYGVRVVTIAPGVFESAMTKMMPNKVRKSLEGVQEFPKRMGNAEEFSSLVQQCITNRMLNATVLRLDGGVRMPSKM